jgi:hypothetical protein
MVSTVPIYRGEGGGGKERKPDPLTNLTKILTKKFFHYLTEANKEKGEPEWGGCGREQKKQT